MTTFLVDSGIILYSGLIELARRFVPPLFIRKPLRERWNIGERNSLPRPIAERKSRTVVWVHAASLGEVKLLLRFVEVLEQRNPSDCYVATATSRAGVAHLMQAKRPSIIAAGFLPFDTLPLMRRLIKTFGVSRLWLLETELWPAMLKTCIDAGIPIGIANARIEEKSFGNYYRLRALFGPLLNKFEVVLVQNETYADRFRKLGVQSGVLHVVGNIKGHIRLRRASRGERDGLRAAMRINDDELVVVAGCMHAGEGGVVRDALARLAACGRTLKCIVVPRHLAEADALAAELGDPTVRLPEPAADRPWTLCTVEKLGVLAALYGIADAAIVGGTFVPIGGHNVWEPAAWCIPVFFGPDYHSQTSGCETLLAGGVGFCVRSAGELAQGLEKTLWLERSSFATVSTHFADEINRRQNILEPLIP